MHAGYPFSGSRVASPNFDWSCAADGTRLAAPRDEAQVQAMVDWLKGKSPWVDGDTEVRT